MILGVVAFVLTTVFGAFFLLCLLIAYWIHGVSTLMLEVMACLFFLTGFAVGFFKRHFQKNNINTPQ